MNFGVHEIITVRPRYETLFISAILQLIEGITFTYARFFFITRHQEVFDIKFNVLNVFDDAKNNAIKNRGY